MELTEKFKHLEENIKVLREIKETVTLEELKVNKRFLDYLDDFIAFGVQMQEHI